jgi:hypothetical protein
MKGKDARDKIQELRDKEQDAKWKTGASIALPRL